MSIQESTSQLIESIVNIVGSDNNISYIKDNICYGNFYTKRGFVTEISAATPMNNRWVRLTRISKVNFRKFMDWRSNNYSYGYSDRKLDSSGYFTIFNPSYSNRRREKQNHFWMGCNVDKDLKLSGYSFNICDIYNSFDLEAGRSNEEYQRHIYKLIFIGNKNFLIGFIDKSCVLYLDNNLLESIKQANYEKFTEIIKKIFSLYSIANMSFFNGNICGLEGQITEYLLRKYMKKVGTETMDASFIQVEELDIFSSDDVCDRIVNKICSNIKSEIEAMLQGTSWGISNQYSYNQLVANIIRSRDQSHKDEIDKAFAKGLLYGNKFELCGWEVCDDFKYSQEVAWMKKVDIVPTRAVYQGKLYNINNNDSWSNPFKIDTIYVTLNGKMWCDGNHPNVSSGQVCMGDISQKISLSDPTTLGENLNKCEALLTLINYDSAYTSSDREYILSHSTLDISNSGVLDTEYVGENEVLTDISFEDDEDESVHEDVDGCETVEDTESPEVDL